MKIQRVQVLAPNRGGSISESHAIGKSDFVSIDIVQSVRIIIEPGVAGIETREDAGKSPGIHNGGKSWINRQRADKIARQASAAEIPTAPAIAALEDPAPVECIGGQRKIA